MSLATIVAVTLAMVGGICLQGCGQAQPQAASQKVNSASSICAVPTSGSCPSGLEDAGTTMNSMKICGTCSGSWNIESNGVKCDGKAVAQCDTSDHKMPHVISSTRAPSTSVRTYLRTTTSTTMAAASTGNIFSATRKSIQYTLGEGSYCTCGGRATLTLDFNVTIESVQNMESLVDVYRKHASMYSSTSRAKLTQLAGAVPSVPVGHFLKQLLELLGTDLAGDLKAEQPMLEDLAKVHMLKFHAVGPFSVQTRLSGSCQEYNACVDVEQVTFSDGHQLQAFSSGVYQCAKPCDSAIKLDRVSAGNMTLDAGVISI